MKEEELNHLNAQCPVGLVTLRFKKSKVVKNIFNLLYGNFISLNFSIFEKFLVQRNQQKFLVL